MNISMAIFTFLNTWCIALFLVLPFFAKTDRRPIPWKKIMVVDTIISFIIVAAIALIIKSGIVAVHIQS